MRTETSMRAYDQGKSAEVAYLSTVATGERKQTATKRVREHLAAASRALAGSAEQHELDGRAAGAAILAGGGA